MTSIDHMCFKMKRNLRSHGSTNNPIGKKKSKGNSMGMETYPTDAFPAEAVPARTAIHTACPATPKSMSKSNSPKDGHHGSPVDSPNGISDEKKYAIPLNPESREAKLWKSSTHCSNMTGAYFELESEREFFHEYYEEFSHM